MRLERYAYSGAKRLRCGYTTGSCAAAAAKAAALLLFGGTIPETVTIDTPSGVPLTLTVEQPESGDGWASCGIRKDAGDDADATDGALIRARVSMRGAPSVDNPDAKDSGVLSIVMPTVSDMPTTATAQAADTDTASATTASATTASATITIDGGAGVGRVTRAGLEQPIGSAAINRVPREMIAREVRAALESLGMSRGFESSLGALCGLKTSPEMSCGFETPLGISCGLDIVISVDGGAEIAARTYNPRLGITGGVSILGTTGIVEPMSEAALVDTIRAELNVLRAQGSGCILMTPGSYGETFARETLGLPVTRSVLCSNFIGDALEYATGLGFDGILLVGHIGKLAKLAGGIYNTHSRVADGRMETLSAHAALAGADAALIRSIMGAITTDEALELIKSAGLLSEVMRTLLEKIEFHMHVKAGNLPVGAIVFSNVYGVLGRTAGADDITNKLKNSGGNG